MDLSPEDALRINVLLANKPQAIRIHESSMTLFGLTESGEASVKLNPNCRDEQYIKKVKEVLSSHISGSPGGYPVFIQRWTRMGQMRDDSLEQLLMLGEPEAVVAAVCATGLTDELARRAWWAMEDAENARRMLEHEVVVGGDMGPVLANYLIEHLPFETEPEKMIETVRLVLQPGLTDESVRAELWKKGLRKGAYHVGFILTTPDDLPVEATSHVLFAEVSSGLEKLADNGNQLAAFLNKLLSNKGQTFLAALKTILKKPSNQEVVNTALDAVRYYFAPMRPEGNPDQSFEELSEEARQFVSQEVDEVMDLIELHEKIPEILRSARVLSGMGYGILRPVFHDTSAIGSLMRRKLEPVFIPLHEEIKILTG
ncbi:MAG: sulfur reduction protein DsrS [Gammaproteobacteria bacterium]|nr:sulfur reduction protein DsrS [Gammaproteobacteria bacterium]NNJ91271.1 sulfur reduction protein DsrS [Gammaproteobacteria bacterium]